MLNIFILGTVFVLALGQHTTRIATDCLNCICQASTGCDTTIGCHNAGPGAYYCGPYLISWGYWAEAGRPGKDPRNPHDFEVCLKTKECSEQAIDGYMQKWAHDCDKDGDVDCYDISSIHKAGPYGCNATWFYNTEYWKIFSSCYGY